MPLWRPPRFCDKKRSNKPKPEASHPHDRRAGVLDRRQRHPRGIDRARQRPAAAVPASRHRHRADGAGARSRSQRARACSRRRIRALAAPSSRSRSIPSTTSPISISTCSSSSTCATSIVVGVSFGGWIAAEIAIKSTARISHLVLANAVGIKVGDRETRDIVDIFAMPESEFVAARLFRSGRRQARLQGDARGRSAGRGAQPRSDGAVRLVALHAQSEAQAAACTASAFRPCSCGARPTASCPSPTGAPIAPLFPARASSRSSAPGIFRTWSSRRSSPPCARFAIRRRRATRATPEETACSLSVHRAALSRAWNDHKARCASTCRTANAIRSRGRSVPPLLRRMAARRRARLRHHAQRAPSDRDLHVVDRDRRAVGAGAADQARAPARARLSDRAPARSAARAPRSSSTIDVISRGRLDMGFIKGVPYEFPCIQPESGRRDGPLLGGARLHHQGDDQPRRAVQLGERALPLPAGQHLAAPVAAAASAGLEHHRQQTQCARAGRAAAT